jgi:hypothetical protein
MTIPLWTHSSLVGQLKSRAGPLKAAVHAAAADPTKPSKDAWYQASYDTFMSTPRGVPPTPDDLAHVMASAYSWVATIPNSNPKPHFTRFLNAINAVFMVERTTPYIVAANREARLQALRAVQRVLSIADTAESVVIVSKVLHFWDAAVAPMIDANVAVGWQRLAALPHWQDALRASGNQEVKTISDTKRATVPLVLGVRLPMPGVRARCKLPRA